MAYELSEEKNLKKVLGIATYAGVRLLTGSPEASTFLKDKVEKTIDYFDDESDRTTISGILEDIVGKSWEVACSGYELPIECRRELAQYNIVGNLDDWASIPTIRYNIARICSKYNVNLNTIDTGDIARKLLRCIVVRVDDDPYLKTRDSLREIINNTERANEKLDIILDNLSVCKGNDPRLYGRLMERFINQRSNHPSIKMMVPDSRLFPVGIPAIISSDRTAIEGDQGPFSIKKMILKSWEE